MPASPDKVFGVQRHDADRAGLHYDLRLERDGVLKSWSMPKGMPTTKRRLALATPDHKMSWLEFEGDIPKGSYGAGNVKLDSKSTFKTVSYKPKKWVFYVNSGKYQGKYTLVYWKDYLWLISRNKDQSMAAENTEGKIKRLMKTYEPKAKGGKKKVPYWLVSGEVCPKCDTSRRSWDYPSYHCAACRSCLYCCDCLEEGPEIPRFYGKLKAENTEVLNAEWFTWYSGQYVLVRNVYRIYNRSVIGEEIVLPEEYSILDDAVEELVNLIEYDTSVFEMGVYKIQSGMDPKVTLEVKYKHQEFSGYNPEAVEMADEKSYDRWNRDYLIDEPDDFLIGATDYGDIVSEVFTEASEDETNKKLYFMDPKRRLRKLIKDIDIDPETAAKRISFNADWKD